MDRPWSREKQDCRGGGCGGGWMVGLKVVIGAIDGKEREVVMRETINAVFTVSAATHCAWRSSGFYIPERCR